MARSARSVFFALIGILFAAAAVADDFRVESKVYVGDQEEPSSQSVTLFQGGVVYDFLTGSQQIAVFKKNFGAEGGRIILLDPLHKVRTELTTDQVAAFMADLQALADTKDDPLLKFAVRPSFQQSFDEREGEMTFSSEAMTYRILTLRAESETAAREYRDFSDWSARLGAILEPSGTPPFPRLAVNAALVERQVIPREVRLTIPMQSGLRKQTVSVRSEHRVDWRLSQDDRKKIDDAAGYLATFRQVGLQEFRGK